MAYNGLTCNNWFDCQDERTRNLGFEQAFKLLFTKDANGCPSLRTSGAGGGGGGGAVTLPSTARVPSRTVVTTSGSVAAGARSVALELSSDFVGSILGDNTVIAGAIYPFVVYQNDDTLAAIAYTITSGSITISKNV